MRAGSMIGVAMLAAAVAPSAIAQKPAATADYEFDYSYPVQAARIAPLKAWLEADKAKRRAWVVRASAEARREAKAARAPFRAYELQQSWDVVTETPRFLSLSSASYSDTGGAHGNGSSGGLIWDKRAGRRMNAVSLFVSPAAFQSAVMTPWCRWMRAERTRRVGADAGNDTTFGQCPPAKDVTVLLGSSNGRALNRIGVIADQYVVGSYVEGPYEHTLPVTQAVLRAVKPEYRAAFAVR
ncbi:MULTISPECIES: DUF4163 domain-containing protein [Sphingomonas]|uniref:DUF4163 domain-containing protein n=1 Tax=Sphingomonas TaxID=13687 RepID=UPI000A772B11|nr:MULTISPECIES: DUF4163 domain-containing protein [Sphingomonas]WCP73440.1 DUF4163 domain-containing protein [Sphingomonas hankookensis]